MYAYQNTWWWIFNLIRIMVAQRPLLWFHLDTCTELQEVTLYAEEKAVCIVPDLGGDNIFCLFRDMTFLTNTSPTVE
jgi:hypothetical protein